MKSHHRLMLTLSVILAVYAIILASAAIITGDWKEIIAPGFSPVRGMYFFALEIVFFPAGIIIAQLACTEMDEEFLRDRERRKTLLP